MSCLKYTGDIDVDGMWNTPMFMNVDVMSEKHWYHKCWCHVKYADVINVDVMSNKNSDVMNVDVMWNTLMSSM